MTRSRVAERIPPRIVSGEVRRGPYWLRTDKKRKHTFCCDPQVGNDPEIEVW